MINPEGMPSTFWRRCDDAGTCHCDWRLTLGQCEEDRPMFIIYLINAIISGIVTAIAVGLLCYRIVRRKQPIFHIHTPTGFIRPNPIEAMLFMAIVYNLLRMIQAIIIISDAAPHPIFRSFMYEIPWQFGISAFACYVFGIAHTVADSSKAIYSAWINSPILIDLISTIFICLPFITNNICSIAAGVYAYHGNEFLAAQFTHALYYLWTVYCGLLGFIILLAGIRLLRLLQHHLSLQHDLRVNIAKIRTGAFKVKMIVMVACVCLWVFAFVLCMYGVFRDQLMESTTFNVLIAAVWTYDGPMATLLVEIALILNPRMTASLGVSGISTTDSFTNSKTQSDVHNTVTLDTAYSSVKWNMLNTSSHTSGVTGGDMSPTLNPATLDTLPRYSVGNGSTDLLKTTYRGALSDPTRSGSPPPMLDRFHPGIEQERQHYNATTGQMRVPPRYNLSPGSEMSSLDTFDDMPTKMPLTSTHPGRY